MKPKEMEDLIFNKLRRNYDEMEGEICDLRKDIAAIEDEARQLRRKNAGLNRLFFRTLDLLDDIEKAQLRFQEEDKR